MKPLPLQKSGGSSPTQKHCMIPHIPTLRHLFTTRLECTTVVHPSSRGDPDVFSSILHTGMLPENSLDCTKLVSAEPCQPRVTTPSAVLEIASKYAPRCKPYFVVRLFESAWCWGAVEAELMYISEASPSSATGS